MLFDNKLDDYNLVSKYYMLLFLGTYFTYFEVVIIRHFASGMLSSDGRIH